MPSSKGQFLFGSSEGNREPNDTHFLLGRTGTRDSAITDSAPQDMEPGTRPRITKLMALALKFDRLGRERVVEDYAELARLGHVSLARMTQIMGLLNLAPEIQEEILFLPKTVKGRDPISARQVLKLGAVEDWEKQRRRWCRLKA